MVETLKEVVLQLRQYGYSTQIIREHLLAQGYASADVDAALVVAEKSKKMFVILGISFVGVLAILLVLLLANPAPQARKALPLQVDLQFPKVEFAPGEEIVFRLNVAARSGQHAAFGVELHALPSRKRVYAKEETESLTGSVSKVVSLQPSVLAEGLYVVTATVKTQKDSASALANIRIKVPEAAENVSIPVLAVNDSDTGLNVSNSRTQDDSLKTVLLANTWAPHFFRVLNERELVLRVGDISLGVHTSPSGTILSVLPDAQGSVQLTLTKSALAGANEEWCKAAPKPIQDDCLRELALFTRQYLTCKQVKDAHLRDECFVAFALEGNYQVCEFLSDSDWREQCSALSQQPTYAKTS